MENTNNETIKYCKDLLGLCFTSPDCNEDQYFHAFSFDKDILVNMIDNINIEERNFYSIKNIRLFEYRPLSIPTKYNFVDPNSPIIPDKYNFILQVDDYLEYNKVLAPIYGYNFIKNNLCEQVLLSTEIISLNMKKSGISLNSIKIDTFYGESILNA